MFLWLVPAAEVACGFMDNDRVAGSAHRSGSWLEKRASQTLASVSGLVMGGLIASLFVIAVYVLRWRMGW